MALKVINLRFILLWACLFSGPLMAEHMVSTGQELTHLTVGKNIKYFVVDDNKPVDIKKLLAQPNHFNWLQSHFDTPNFGFDTRTHWFWLRLENTSAHPLNRLLEIAHPIIDNIDVYFKTKKTIKHWQTGDHTAFSQRPVNHHNFVFPLRLDSMLQADVFIRIQTSTSMQLPLTLWNEINFYASQQIKNVLNGIFIGFFFVMILYNAFLFISLRESSYLYYVLTAASFLIIFLSISGYGYLLLWGNQIVFQQYSTLFSIAISQLALAQFTLHSLKIPKQDRRTYWVLKSIVIITV